MASGEFFERPEEQSIIKSMLVANYFKMWSSIMLPRLRGRDEYLAYVDLFSGPGRYGDGSPSTPLLVLKQAIEDPKLSKHLVTMFNDKERGYVQQLKTEVASLPGIERLAHQPQITNSEVGRDLVALVQGNRLGPTLFFIDPFGYKGLSLDLIGSAIRSWGCDCIFFFNYNRVNAGITNPTVNELMNDLFGATRMSVLQSRIAGRSADERQAIIVSELSEALKEVGGKFVLPFEFKSQHGERTSHYIIFVSKAFLGYHLMKEAMFGLSTDVSDVRSFEYVPVKSTQMSLFPDFGKDHSIPVLKEVLLESVAGRRLSVWDVYESVTVDTPYTFKNVQNALRALEEEGRVTIDPPAARRPKRNGEVTLAKDKVVTFPP